MNAGPVRIVIATDERSAMPAAASVRSVIDRLPPHDALDVAVLACDLSPATRHRLHRSWTDPRCTVTFLDVTLATFDGLPVVSAQGVEVTAGVYARLLIGELLPADWTRVIYPDTDTITRHPITDLWTTDLQGRLLGAVTDDYIPTVSSPYGLPTWQHLGLHPDLPYFNTGVMLIDLDAWRRHRLGQRALTYLRDHRDDIRLFDQDALNAVTAGRWLPLDTLWNVTGFWRKPHRRTGRHTTILTDARIRHYAGYGKPWHPQPLDIPDAHLFFTSLDRTDWTGWRPNQLPTPDPAPPSQDEPCSG